MVRLRKPTINHSYRLRCLSFITSFRLIPFENKLVSMVVTYPGFLTYLPATESATIFQFMYFPVTNPRIKAWFRRPSLSLFYYIRKLTLVSLLELTPGAGIKYARSAGVSAKVLKSDPTTHTALVQLPSKVRKLFSLYSLASVGSVALKEKKLLKNTKSGYWRTYGVKPKVRGVAKNPVDHPHGGRTKSIKYPRTPWGKTTKFK